MSSGLHRNSAATPPANLFSGEAGIQTDFWSADAGLTQRLKWGGASYDVAFISQRTTTDNPFTSFTPSLTSALQAIFSQPLLRDFKIDSARAQIEIERRNRDIADIQVRERSAQVAANAESRVLGAGGVAGARSTCSSARWISRWSSSGPTGRGSTSASRRRSIWSRHGPKWPSAART